MADNKNMCNSIVTGAQTALFYYVWKWQANVNLQSIFHKQN